MADPCVICGKPRAIDRKGRPKIHCGEDSCYRATLRGEHSKPEYATGWPKMTDEFTGDFSAHNIKTRTYGSVGLRPVNLSLSGCALK